MLHRARFDRILLFFAGLILPLTLALLHVRAAHAGSRPFVVVAPVEGTVDLGLAPFIDRVLTDAERDGAAAVVLDIDTHGGRLDAAVAIRDRLLASRVRTVAFVNPRAISAGALIALAAETIAADSGATIGAATPVQLQPSATATPVDEKTVSYVRKEFRATAEQRGRPAELAEAMVDPDVDLPVAPRGKLLTLTGDEALELGVADLRARDLHGVLREIGLEGAEVRHCSPSWAERATSAVTSPIVSSILMILGITGLMIELRTPGFGIPGLVGLTCLALFFGGHWVVHLAGFEELLLIGMGVVLIALEVFVIPGFGLAGVLGILALSFGLGLSLVGSGATAGALFTSLGRVALSFIAAVLAVVALFTLLPRVPFARGIVLAAGGPEKASAARTAPEISSMVGARGVTLTPLRPAGTAWVKDQRIDVVTEGEYVGPGVVVDVIQHEGNRIVVRPIEVGHALPHKEPS